MFTYQSLDLGLGLHMKLFVRRHATRLSAALGIFLSLASCDDGGMNGQPVNYGPQSSESDVIHAVYGYLLTNSQPTLTQSGAFVHFASTENIAGGTLSVLIADTGQTTISRTEDDKTVTFNIVEKIVQYHQDSTNQDKIARNYQISFDKAAVATSSAKSAQLEKSSITDDGVGTFIAGPDGLTAAPLSEGALRFATLSFLQKLQPSQSLKAGVKIAGEHVLDTAPTATPSATPVAVPTAAPPPSATFHRLRTWQDDAAAPDAVRAQAGCGGLVGCRIRLRHVLFDIVSHDPGGDNLIHMELVASPDVPQTSGLNMNPIFAFLPGLVRSCITRLVTVGSDGTSKTLVGDCNDVVNFTANINAMIPESTTEKTTDKSTSF